MFDRLRRRVRSPWVEPSRFADLTGQSQQVLTLAQDEARILSDNFVGTEHILLGLLREGEGVAARSLNALGIDLKTLRAEVAQIIGPAGSSNPGALPFTPRAKKVLEQSRREASQLGQKHIGSEHMLLGIVSQGEGVAAQVLMGLCGDLSRVREQVIETLSGHP